jgi:hypothetical protein
MYYRNPIKIMCISMVRITAERKHSATLQQRNFSASTLQTHVHPQSAEALVPVRNFAYFIVWDHLCAFCHYFSSALIHRLKVEDCRFAGVREVGSMPGVDFILQGFHYYGEVKGRIKPYLGYSRNKQLNNQSPRKYYLS